MSFFLPFWFLLSTSKRYLDLKAKPFAKNVQSSSQRPRYRMVSRLHCRTALRPPNLFGGAKNDERKNKYHFRLIPAWGAISESTPLAARRSAAWRDPLLQPKANRERLAAMRGRCLIFFASTTQQLYVASAAQMLHNSSPDLGKLGPQPQQQHMLPGPVVLEVPGPQRGGGKRLACQSSNTWLTGVFFYELRASVGPASS